VILREHIRNPNLSYLAQELERVRPRSAKKLLQALLESNPNRQVQALACFTLATLFKDEAGYGKDKKATAESEKLFQRFVTEFSHAGPGNADLILKAQGALSELRRLSIGKPAPDFEGEDLDGQTVKLSDYRGNVVVISFWKADYSEARDLRKLVDRMRGRPLVSLGINCDDKISKARATVHKYAINWPTIWDDYVGPIFTAWSIHSWPTVFVLDRKGVIRYRDVRGRDLDEAVEMLLRE